MTRTMRTLAATAALTITLVTGACSSSSDTNGHDMGSMSNGMSSGMPSSMSTAMPTAPAPSGNAAGQNQADVTFASSMVPHHQQAVAMADMALANASNASVKDLATQIKAAQDPEIQKMTGWLTSWGAAPMPSGHDMGGGGMDGMMTEQQMSDLDNSSGAAFDRMWLQMMIKHHEGAVTMAKTELAQGQYADAKTLAQTIIDGQTKEIATMTELLKTIG